MTNIEYENKEICSKCEGKCCKKCGCDYFVSDFESMETKYLENFLNQGYASIIATFKFERLKNGKLVLTPILSIRARNTNRDVIDLLSLKTKCLSLTENGCTFDINNRPSGGKHLIPKENFNCQSDIDKIEELYKYMPYQKTLQKLVKKYTGMSIDEKLKEDVKKLMNDLLNDNIEDVSPIELEEIKTLLPLLVEIYPEETRQAYKNIKTLKKLSH